MIDSSLTAEEAIAEVVRILRRGAYDLQYVAPEVWPDRVAGIMHRAWAAAESWEHYELVEDNIDLRNKVFGQQEGDT